MHGAAPILHGSLEGKRQAMSYKLRAVPTNTRVLAPVMVWVVPGQLLRTSARVAQVTGIAGMAYSHPLQVTGVAGMR